MLAGTRQFSAIVAALFAVVASLFVIPAVHAAESDPVTVRGTVISHDGQPLASVRVSFETCVDEFPLGLVCVPENSGDTDGDGGFEIQVAQNTALRIVFDADDNVHSTQVWNGQGETVENIADAGEFSFTEDGPLEVNVQLTKGASIEGSLEGADGQPVDHAAVTVKSAIDGKTVKQGEAQEGSYLLGGLPAGEYEVEFAHNGLSLTETVELTRGQSASLGTLEFTVDQIENLSLPSIEGYAFVGSVLTASPGTWSVAAPNFTYRWFADDDLISGATDASYTISAADLERQIAVEVTAAKAGFPTSEPARSLATENVSLRQIEIVDRPTIQGEAAVGNTLTAASGVWNPSDVSLAYQWFADNEPIAGATGTSLVLREEHADKRINFSVVATKSGYESAEEFSDLTATVEILRLTNTSRPVVSGQTYVGGTLTASTGEWASSKGVWSPVGATFHYRWFLDETEVVGANTGTFVPGTSALGKKVSVSMAVSQAGYRTTEPAYSDPSATIGHPIISNLVLPAVTGSPMVGKTLKVATGTWNEPGVSFKYRWFVDGKVISGATKSTYKVPKSLLGKQISVGVTASKSGFVKSAEVRSAATAKVGYASSLSVKPKAKKKRKVDFSVTVKANKKAVRGKVEIYSGSKKLKTVSLNKKGKATIKLSKQPKGKQTYTVKYLGSGNAKPVTKTVKVTTKK